MPSLKERFVVIGLSTSWYAFSRAETICITLCYQILHLVLSHVCSWEVGREQTCGSSFFRWCWDNGSLLPCLYTTIQVKLTDLISEGAGRNTLGNSNSSHELYPWIYALCHSWSLRVHMCLAQLGAEHFSLEALFKDD